MQRSSISTSARDVALAGQQTKRPRSSSRASNVHPREYRETEHVPPAPYAESLTPTATPGMYGSQPSPNHPQRPHQRVPGPPQPEWRLSPAPQNPQSQQQSWHHPPPPPPPPPPHSGPAYNPSTYGPIHPTVNTNAPLPPLPGKLGVDTSKWGVRYNQQLHGQTPPPLPVCGLIPARCLDVTDHRICIASSREHNGPVEHVDRGELSCSQPACVDRSSRPSCQHRGASAMGRRV